MGEPALNFIASQPTVYTAHVSDATWNASSWAPSDGYKNLPWVEVHADREISTMLVRSPCRLVPDATNDEIAQHTAAALTKIALQVPELSWSNETKFQATQINFSI